MFGRRFLSRTQVPETKWRKIFILTFPSSQLRCRWKELAKIKYPFWKSILSPVASDEQKEQKKHWKWFKSVTKLPSQTVTSTQIGISSKQSIVRTEIKQLYILIHRWDRKWKISRCQCNIDLLKGFFNKTHIHRANANVRVRAHSRHHLPHGRQIYCKRESNRTGSHSKRDAICVPFEEKKKREKKEVQQTP